MLVEKRRCSLQTVCFNPTGRQLERERNPIQLSADARDYACIGIVDIDMDAAGLRAIQEQLRRRKRQDRLGRKIRVIRRVTKNIQFVNALTLDAQSLAAGS